jgi:PKHD-type hydroxylase
MSLILEGVLPPEDLQRVRRELAELKWSSGKRTAGSAARGVKENLQADGSDPRVQALETFVLEALRRHPMFEIAAWPMRLTRLLFSRYEPGMTYGAHTDVALMSTADLPVRTDLAFTIFLEDRDKHEGGALVIESALGAQEIKLEAGDAILYPAGSIHYVAPVTQGARLAAVGWVQSHIADGAQREMLFDLSVLRTRLATAGLAREDLLVLDKSISNLLRMWAR